MHKSICFVTAGLDFNGNSVYEKALGGSESALIYMAKETAALGHEVTVYCKCDKPAIYDNVDYRPLEKYMKDDICQFDVIIVSRFTDFLAVPIDSKLNILWCHDIDSANFRDAIGVADRVFCLSEYHKSLFVNNYTIEPTNYIWKTSNGYDQSIVTTKKSFDEKKNNYIYSSRPERGLKYLLEKIWPEVLDINPDAILHLCGYEHTLGVSEDIQKIYDDIDELLEYSTNVKMVGHLPKPEYYELLSNCAYMLYPTDFPEISCINAIEAQYNECMIITTHNFALSETVKSQTTVKSKYGTQEYFDEFLSLVKKYQDNDLYNQAINKARLDIEKYSWATVAKSWNKEIDSMFNKRFEKHKSKILDQLVYNSDIVAAYKLTGDEKYRKLLDKADYYNKNVVLAREDYNADEDCMLDERGIHLITVVDDLIKKTPAKKLKIVDIGSNDGVLSMPLMKRFSNNISEMILVDTYKPILDIVEKKYKSKYPQLKFIVDSVFNILNYDIKPDIVILGEIMEHLEDTKEFLNTVIKLAQIDTLFYFTTPTGPWDNMVINKEEINHVHHFERSDIKQLFKNIDFTLIHTADHVLGRRNEPCSNMSFWFTCSAGDNIEFGEIDYNEKWLKTRPYKSISACMIVKNEEDNISRCLKSLNGFVDELVIVDTGSTDDTKRIAEKYTDKIYDLEWLEEDGLGNFSRARNYSIDQASGDYIFWIDADEQVEGWKHIFKYITSDYYDGLLLKQKQCMSLDSHKMGINVDVMHDRLFKRGKIRFTGVVHEYPSKDDEHFLGRMFWQDYAWILHYGLANHELLKRKSIGRNSDLIYKNVRTYPDRVFAKHYILVDYWSKFVTDHPTPDFSWIERAMELWHNELKTCGDDWTIRLSLGVVQHFYSYCAVNNIAYKGKIPEKLMYQNVNGEVIDFYVLDEDTEREFFFKYLSTYKR